MWTKSAFIVPVRFVGACVAAALIAGFASFLWNSSVGTVSAKATRAPMTAFSADISLTRFGPDGTLATRTTWKYYRFSDGSYATGDETQVEPTPLQLVRHSYDFELHQELLIEPTTKSVITFRRTPEELSSFVDGVWEENCPVEGDVAATGLGELILGYPTTHITKKWDRTWTQDRWMVNSLNCFSLRQVDVSGTSKNETTVTSLSPGEPPRSVLSAPEGYTQRSPTEVAKEFAEVNGGKLFVPAQALKYLTKDYESHLR